ncbi:MAG: ArsR/SmtB family transcription factor [Anaerolineales bacterium]|jgi:DNA-binding transcriptional ArsR family regulator
MIDLSYIENTASLLRAISQTARLEILLAIGTGEACVCHLEAAIGQRQAYISQQLMALRDAGIVESRREGRNIYYHVSNPHVLDLIQAASMISNQQSEPIPITGPRNLQGECPCPKCEPQNPEESAGKFILVRDSHISIEEKISHDR